MVLKNERKTLGHAVMFLMVMLVSPAISKDFGILTRMLYAAFLAEQGVALCIVADPAFANETRGPMGYMHDYATHIKAEARRIQSEDKARAFVDRSGHSRRHAGRRCAGRGGEQRNALA